MRSAFNDGPVWVKLLLWSLSLTLALVGAVLSAELSSFWPLIAFLGLAVPMVAVSRVRSTRPGVSESRAG